MTRYAASKFLKFFFLLLLLHLTENTCGCLAFVFSLASGSGGAAYTCMNTLMVKQKEGVA